MQCGVSFKAPEPTSITAEAFVHFQEVSDLQILPVPTGHYPNVALLPCILNTCNKNHDATAVHVHKKPPEHSEFNEVVIKITVLHHWLAVQAIALGKEE